MLLKHQTLDFRNLVNTARVLGPSFIGRKDILKVNTEHLKEHHDE